MIPPTPARRAPVALFALMALALAGCTLFPKPAQDPTRHYVLTGPTTASMNENLHKGTLKVGLRAVEVAPYLDGKAMIVRRGDNEIDYRDYARWAEPVAIGVKRMLVARLVESERVGRVFVQPYPFDTERDIDVAITVLRCEGLIHDDGKAVASLVCDVEITRAGDGAGHGEVLLRERFSGSETEWKDGDYAALARQLSGGVTELAQRVVAAVPAE
jgi:uncharacterized protein